MIRPKISPMAEARFRREAVDRVRGVADDPRAKAEVVSDLRFGRVHHFTRIAINLVRAFVARGDVVRFFGS